MSALFERFRIHDLGFTVLAILLSLFVISYSPIVNSVYAKDSTPSALPQVATVSANYQPLGQVSQQSPQYANLMVNNLLHSFSCILVGYSPIGHPCVDYIQGIPVISSIDTSGGLLGSIMNLTTIVMANPPIRTGQYLATLGNSLGFTKEVYAQVGGTGAGVLKPIENLWQVSRNISYIIMIIIFVVIGLMVMFRTRINPQTVISIQAALPGLVIGLIMITFSYFLASLLVDTAYITTNIVGYYFTAAQGKPEAVLLDNTSDKSVLTIFGQFVGSIGRDDIKGGLDYLFTSLTPEVQELMRFIAGAISFQYGNQVGQIVPVVGQFVGPIVGLGFSVFTAATPPTVFSTVLWIVAIAALIFQMIKLLMRLINCYLHIIFLTITAPFQFLAASLPGRQGITTNWIRNILANVLAFPAVLAVFYFVAYLLGDPRPPFNIIGQPQIAGQNALPLFGGLETSFIRLMLVYGALVATPKIPDLVVEAIGKVGRAGSVIGQEISEANRGGQQYTQRGFAGMQQGATGFAGMADKPVNRYTPDGKVVPGMEMGTFSSAKYGLQSAGKSISTWLNKKPTP